MISTSAWKWSIKRKFFIKNLKWTEMWSIFKRSGQGRRVRGKLSKARGKTKLLNVLNWKAQFSNGKRNLWLVLKRCQKLSKIKLRKDWANCSSIYPFSTPSFIETTTLQVSAFLKSEIFFKSKKALSIKWVIRHHIFTSFCWAK